jgi:hypothetical protein
MSFRNCGSSDQIDKDGEGKKGKCYSPIEAPSSNVARHRIAAREGLGMKLKDRVWAARGALER